MTETDKSPQSGDEFDGDIDDVEMPPEVRAAAEARIAAAVKKYGDTPIDG